MAEEAVHQKQAFQQPQDSQSSVLAVVEAAQGLRLVAAAEVLVQFVFDIAADVLY